MNVDFNKPYLTGNEMLYMHDAVKRLHISGNGEYTKRCQNLIEQKYAFNKCLLTNSCTDALEMASLLCNIQPGDEIIMPSYTFVSTANAFVLRGAKLVFADSCITHPDIDVSEIESLITKRTKVIVPVHYSGVACDMDPILAIAKKYNLFVVEDAAQAIDSYYNGKSLGSIGQFGVFSFHETKNIISGEGGALIVNDPSYAQRAEIIWEKGTNRTAFFRGEVDKYGWVDVGSSFLPSEITAAFLFAQIECIEKIQKKRLEIWNQYYLRLSEMADKRYFQLPYIPHYSSNNAHIFYIHSNSADERIRLSDHLRKNGIYAVFHYLSLHKSPFYADKHDGRSLDNADRFSDGLLRLPMYYELKKEQIDFVCDTIVEYYKK